jgi:hypothetical protein
MLKLTTVDIEIHVANKLDYRKNVIVPNVSWGAGFNHECDLLVVNHRTFVCTEVEIKVSKSDMKADLLKPHGHKSNRIKYLYFAIPVYLLVTAEEILPATAGIITVEKLQGGRLNDPYYYYETHIHRRSQANKASRPLTEKEVINITRLGCMRIWKLKRQLNRPSFKRVHNEVSQPELEFLTV